VLNVEWAWNTLLHRPLILDVSRIMLTTTSGAPSSKAIAPRWATLVRLS
jgi:hypothetical protein